MNRFRTPRRLLAVATGAAALTSAASGQSFTELVIDASVTEMTSDGSTIVGASFFTGQSFYWNETEGIVWIGGNGNPSISDDGSTIVGNTIDNGFETAAMWQGGTNWMPLGTLGETCDAFASSAWGVNGDGSVVVGLGWVPNCRAHGFRWDPINGMVDLGSTVEGSSSRANDVSADGRVIVGWQDATDGFRQGAFWVDGVQTVLFDPTTGFPVGEAQAVNSDGTVIVGGAGAGEFGDQAWRWTEAGGVEAIGVLFGFGSSASAWDMTEDGSIVIGFSGFFSRDAFIWTEAAGMKKLGDFLETAGVPGIGGWRLESALAMSDDGSIMSGFGVNPDGLLASWVLDTTADAMQLDASNFVAGQNATLTIEGATPGQRVYFAYSPQGVGTTDQPALGVTFDLKNARRVGNAIANANGTATLVAPIPASAQGREIWIQAAEMGRTSRFIREVVQ